MGTLYPYIDLNQFLSKIFLFILVLQMEGGEIVLTLTGADDVLLNSENSDQDQNNSDNNIIESWILVFDLLIKHLVQIKYAIITRN